MACAAGYFAVGWLATVDKTWALDWRPFDPLLGFAFAGAFAQLVLAGVVWAQIKTADEALRHARAEAEGAAKRERNQRAADSIATFVGYASNASILYGTTVMRRLRDAVAHPGDVTFVEAARAEIAEANRVRQAAHAERFRIRVRTSEGPEVLAAKAFLDLLDRQDQRAAEILGWSNRYLDPATAPPAGSTAPEPRGMYEDPEPARKRCLDLAAALLVP